MANFRPEQANFYMDLWTLHAIRDTGEILVATYKRESIIIEFNSRDGDPANKSAFSTKSAENTSTHTVLTVAKYTDHLKP